MGGIGSCEWLARLDDWRCYQASSVGDSDEKAGRDPECHTGDRGVVALHVSCCARVGGVTGRVQLPNTILLQPGILLQKCAGRGLGMQFSCSSVCLLVCLAWLLVSIA
ncbi:hypothetical protein CPAR01_00159 [Colletotrichum paranaense]|uniref:Uncharacterized protein n=3 Tax=Colletotrichum acutatum species complex TaxID=2707335 RepID=A0AAI9XHE3_9PEZI|nr:uncharacterized protein CPAR01_00159 [Colletotrichum paranaense]KAK0377005.1 hypothetical protein CLIM01_05664 [Colletotrichum limetticola]KAK1449085.1 hypothetical protein CMEL01_08400 [Colletotrichum melonis]KAK1546192.1 hypothetical protein CPAR01_00159 [Colletotrichum paranaense]